MTVYGGGLMYTVETKSKSNTDTVKKTSGVAAVQRKANSLTDKLDLGQPNKFKSDTHIENEQNTDTQTSVIKENQNQTGLPDQLKNGIENLSGYSMDDVRVHYNSSKPAQLQSLAYARGTEIYIAPGQEKHLGHEAWHVVQQKQGRVSPTVQMKGIQINQNKLLEREADVMGARAVQRKFPNHIINLKKASISPCVQKVAGDLYCTAKICYNEGSPESAEAKGYNDSNDKQEVINVFNHYGFPKLAALQVGDNKMNKKTNPPGQCAEPHAIANALKKGRRPSSKIDAILLTPAYYTDLCKRRIEAEAKGEEIPDYDKDIANMNRGNTDWTRSPCKTCQEWVEHLNNKHGNLGGDFKYAVKEKYMEKNELDQNIKEPELLQADSGCLNTAYSKQKSKISILKSLIAIQNLKKEKQNLERDKKVLEDNNGYLKKEIENIKTLISMNEDLKSKNAILSEKRNQLGNYTEIIKEVESKKEMLQLNIQQLIPKDKLQSEINTLNGKKEEIQSRINDLESVEKNPTFLQWMRKTFCFWRPGEIIVSLEENKKELENRIQELTSDIKKVADIEDELIKLDKSIQGSEIIDQIKKEIQGEEKEIQGIMEEREDLKNKLGYSGMKDTDIQNDIPKKRKLN